MKRRSWVISLAGAAIVIAAGVLATGTGPRPVWESQPDKATFPAEITCSQTTTLCTSGRSANERVFKLLRVATSAKAVQIVGVGADTADGGQVTPLVCTRSQSDIRCGHQPPGGEQHVALYLPA